jgi:hypothetical protein
LTTSLSISSGGGPDPNDPNKRGPNIGSTNLGSSSANGFQAGSQDWMGENILQAQANVQAELNERKERAVSRLIKDKPEITEEGLYPPN